MFFLYLNKNNRMNKVKSTQIPFILITCLFFLWGFAHNLDPILIPHLKKSFTLTTTQSTLVDSSVFIAYFIYHNHTTNKKQSHKNWVVFYVMNPIPDFIFSFTKSKVSLTNRPALRIDSSCAKFLIWIAI